MQSLFSYSLCCFWMVGGGIASYSLISILASLCSLQSLDADLKVVRIGKALLKLFRHHVINIPSSEDKTTVQELGFSRSSPDSKLPTQVLCNKMSKNQGSRFGSTIYLTVVPFDSILGIAMPFG
jgi:hypothetical protein